MRQSRPLRFEQTPAGCFIPTSHKLNQDGYFRKTWGTIKKGSRDVEMFHRFIWRAHHGEIPQGWEIDHKCKVRACCNVAHLQCIPRDKHLDETNRTRYSARLSAAETYWRRSCCTGMHLAETFGVSFSAACRWIRAWKETP